MTQSAINMHTSQISHGVVKPDDFGALNVIVTGYTPSMIKIVPLEDDLDPIDVCLWYDTMPEHIFHPGDGSVYDSFVEVTETGFVLDGVALVAIEAATEGFIWETYGCHNDGSYRQIMNPAPVQAGDPMDFIQPVVDDGPAIEDPDPGNGEGEGEGEYIPGGMD